VVYDHAVARLSFAALVWLLPAAAAAQFHTASFDPATRELSCDAIGPTYASCPGCDSGEICREVSTGTFLCAAEDALFCIPFDSASEGRCPLGATREISLPGGVKLCVRAGIALCTTSDPVACFIPPAGDGPVRYEAGDCDDDGFANRSDPDPCAAPRRLAVAGRDGSCTPLEPCALDVECSPPFDSCDPVHPDEPHWFCAPGGDPLAFCCGGFAGLECAAGPCGSSAIPDDFGFCEDPRFCGDRGWSFEQRVACLTGADGFPVAPERGDCDEDGTPNDVDPAPCVARMNIAAGAPAAGPPPGADAGPPPPGEDAGPPVGSMDAGAPAPTTPSFGGGSGCRCEAVAPPTPRPWPWLVLAALGSLRARSSRARRASRARRP